MPEKDIYDWLVKYPAALFYVDQDNDKIYLISNKGFFITINGYSKIPVNELRKFINNMVR